MAEQRPEDEFVVYASSQNRHLFDSSHTNVRIQVVPAPGYLGRRATQILFLQHELRRGSLDILHLLEGPMPFVAGPRIVATVYDLAPLLSPSSFTMKARIYYWSTLHLAPYGGSRFITISDKVAAEMTSVLGIAPARITTTPLAPAAHFRAADPEEVRAVRMRYRLPPQYFIHTGTIEPRKNLVRLLEAFNELAESDSETGLVFVGKKGWCYDDVFEAVHRLRLEARVHFLGHVPDAELAPLYTGAIALTYPSLMEGFGLPIIEAMSCGVAVICADRSPMKDIAAGGAVLVDPTDPKAIAAGMAALLTRPRLRDRLQRTGSRAAARYGWAAVGEQTLRLYDSITRISS